ncbi:MAG: DUF1800 domain-containing protein [Beijerinckiaceae bacterium]|nr:DUF1800 domain-containing protein [Beijerinckiaceae bacterium]
MSSRRWRPFILFLFALWACALSPAFGRDGAPTARDAAFISALTFGVTPSDMADYRKMGRDGWLKRQLRPPPDQRLPAAAQAQIDELAEIRRSPLELVAEFDARNRAVAQMDSPETKDAARRAVQEGMNNVVRQAKAASILRALYGPDQLRARMTWFWFNHFNVSQGKANLRLLVGDYEARAIRPHALGSFRALLGATLRHPAMIRYLDNAENAAGKINENYAREIMELHTMGVGSGYTQKDVEELARILTGVGLDMKPDDPKLKPEWRHLLVREGYWTFNPARHDFGDKIFLGQKIRGRGFEEVEEALDILARQAATARHVSTRIAAYFVADAPPPKLIDRMAKTFQNSKGDIAAVLEAMIRSPEFEASLGQRFKDPVRYIYSAVRLAYDGKVVSNVQPIQNWLARLGEGLYMRQTPDGYGLASTAWNGSGQMTARFEIARLIGSGPAGLFKPPGADGERPGFPLLQNELWFSTLRHNLSPATRAALDKATSPQDWNTLYLSSPDFMH